MSRPVQTLLLDPTYWKTRLEGVQNGSGTWLSSPREDLSDKCRSVEEFRLKAHDGQILWGLVSYPTFFNGARPCCIRATGPADPIELDPVAAEKGTIEILVQSPAGRRLEDRVLDLLRIYHQARRQPGIQSQALEIAADPVGSVDTRGTQSPRSTGSNPDPVDQQNLRAVDSRSRSQGQGMASSSRVANSGERSSGSVSSGTVSSADPMNPESALSVKRSRLPSDEAWIAREILRRLP